MAPYPVRFSQVVNRFGTTRPRWELLQGLAGSFLEDVESLRGRAPADIDVVSFLLPPRDTDPREWLAHHAGLLSPAAAKRLYRCDAYIVDLGLGARRPDQLVHQARYWYGLFSHQRASQLWKGMLLVDLFSDDDSLGDEWLPKEVDDVAED
jgi:hypothetical protein